MKLHDFLVEPAMFPFPHPNEDQTTDTTDVSQFEVGMLDVEWKAWYAVRDDNLDQKLCQTLEDILGDVPLATTSSLSFNPVFNSFYQDYGAIGDVYQDNAAVKWLLPLYVWHRPFLADVLPLTCSLALSDQNRCGEGNCSWSTYVPLRKMKPYEAHSH